MDPATQAVTVLPLPAGVAAPKERKWYGSLAAGLDGALYSAPNSAVHSRSSPSRVECPVGWPVFGSNDPPDSPQSRSS